MFRFFIKPSSGSHSCLLKLLVVRYYFSKYAGNMSCFILIGSDIILLVFLVLTSCIRACRAWFYEKPKHVGVPIILVFYPFNN